jgi:hypothetical protein
VFYENRPVWSNRVPEVVGVGGFDRQYLDRILSPLAVPPSLGYLLPVARV